MTSDRRAEIEARVERVTPTTLRFVGSAYPEPEPPEWWAVDAQGHVIFADHYPGDGRDVIFFVHGPQDIRDLLAALAEAEAKIAAVRALVADLQVSDAPLHAVACGSHYEDIFGDYEGYRKAQWESALAEKLLVALDAAPEAVGE